MSVKRPKDTPRGQRLRQLRRDLLGFKSQVAMADALVKGGHLRSLSRGAVGNWEQGQEIGLEGARAVTALALTKGYRVTLEWLMDGTPPGPEPTSRPLAYSTFDPDEEWRPEPEFEGEAYTREEWKPKTPGAIPELDLKYGAGEGSVGEVMVLKAGAETISGHRIIDEWPFPENFLRSIGGSIGQSIVGEIIGDSMLPSYLPGDRVVVDLSQDMMMADGIYVYSDGFSPPQVKRLQRVPFSDPPQVDIISDNPAYKTVRAELSRMRIYGKVTWHIGRQ